MSCNSSPASKRHFLEDLNKVRVDKQCLANSVGKEKRKTENRINNFTIFLLVLINKLYQCGNRIVEASMGNGERTFKIQEKGFRLLQLQE